MENDPTITLGIFKGKHASECDVSYLLWYRGIKWMSKKVKDELKAHLLERGVTEDQINAHEKTDVQVRKAPAQAGARKNPPLQTPIEVAGKTGTEEGAP